MKKLLVGLLTLTTASAFAGSANMVRFTNIDNDNTTRSFDVSFDTTENASSVEDSESSSNHVALNYARAFGQFQVGLTFKNYADADGDDRTLGLSGYYNMNSDLLNTCYVGLHYNMKTFAEATDTASNGDVYATESVEIAIEAGHRWAIGSAWGFNLTYAPSVQLSTTVTSYDSDTASDKYEDQTKNAVAWNWLKFDVLF